MNGIRPPRRALVVTLRFLGDALLSTPLVRALKQRFPECAVDVLVFSGSQGVFEGNRDVTHVIAVPELTTAGDTLRQVRALWRQYDLAVIAQTGTRPFLFGWAAGRQRIGLVSPEIGKSWWKRALLDRHAVFDPGGARVLENQRIAQLLGIDGMPAVVAPTAGWGAPEVASALGFDPTAEPFAVLHPSPRWRYKQWTAEGWRALIDALQARQLRVVVTGGPGTEERAYVDSVLQGVEAAKVTRRDGRIVLCADGRCPAPGLALHRTGHGDHAPGGGLRDAGRGALRADRSGHLGPVAARAGRAYDGSPRSSYAATCCCCRTRIWPACHASSKVASGIAAVTRSASTACRPNA